MQQYKLRFKSVFLLPVDLNKAHLIAIQDKTVIKVATRASEHNFDQTVVPNPDKQKKATLLA